MNTKTVINYDAFPTSLRKDIEIINDKLKFESSYYSSETIDVIVSDELIRLPYRIYFNEPDSNLENQLNSKQKLILNSYFTRHHNGYIREKRLKEIILSNELWIVPYIMQLTSEYIIEIVNVIFNNLNNIDTDNYLKFISDNGNFYQRNKQRAISYWNCYYRTKYKSLKDYPGYQILYYFDHLMKQK